MFYSKNRFVYIFVNLIRRIDEWSRSVQANVPNDERHQLHVVQRHSLNLPSTLPNTVSSQATFNRKLTLPKQKTKTNNNISSFFFTNCVNRSSPIVEYKESIQSNAYLKLISNVLQKKVISIVKIPQDELELVDDA